jgi:hypothetical protein
MNGPNKSKLGTILLIAIVGYGIYSTLVFEQKLGECSFSREAEVLFTNKNIGKSPTVHYKYVVEGEKYEVSQIIPKHLHRSDFPTGKNVKIVVSCEDHDISKLAPND